MLLSDLSIRNSKPIDRLKKLSDCGGLRACLDWPAGYCARAGCTTSANCEVDTFCANVDGVATCVRRCGGAQPPCRVSDGYTCQTLNDIQGTPQGGACVPQ